MDRGSKFHSSYAIPGHRKPLFLLGIFAPVEMSPEEPEYLAGLGHENGDGESQEHPALNEHVAGGIDLTQSVTFEFGGKLFS